MVIAASTARSFVQISKRDRTQRVMPRLKTLFAAVFGSGTQGLSDGKKVQVTCVTLPYIIDAFKPLHQYMFKGS